MQKNLFADAVYLQGVKDLLNDFLVVDWEQYDAPWVNIIYDAFKLTSDPE